MAFWPHPKERKSQATQLLLFSSAAGPLYVIGASAEDKTCWLSYSESFNWRVSGGQLELHSPAFWVRNMRPMLPLASGACLGRRLVGKLAPPYHRQRELEGGPSVGCFGAVDATRLPL
jgi:hypothetical protein